MSIRGIRDLTVVERAAASLVADSFKKKDQVKDDLSDFQEGDERFALNWFQEKFLTDLLKITFDEGRLHISDARRQVVETLHRTLNALDDSTIGREPNVVRTLSALRHFAQPAPIDTLLIPLSIGGWRSRLTIKGRIPAHESDLIPVSNKFYDFVPILDDNLSDPKYAARIVDEFVRRIEILRDEENITSLCFIEKDAGPVGALAMLAPIVARTNLSAVIFREPYWSKHGNLVGTRPAPNDRVAVVYDFVVTGGGLGHAARALRNEIGCSVVAAVVLCSYGKPRLPLIKDHSKIRLESLCWYSEEEGRIRSAIVKARARRSTVGGTDAGDAVEDVPGSKWAFAATPTVERDMPLLRKLLRWPSSFSKPDGGSTNDANEPNHSGPKEPPTLSPEEFEQRKKKGERIYERLRDKLEPMHNGEFVAIDVERSTDSNPIYIVGRHLNEVVQRVGEEFGGRATWIACVGEPIRINAPF